MPPLNNIDMSVMSKQLEGLFKDLSSNLKIENIEGMEDFNPDDMEEYDDEEGEENGGKIEQEEIDAVVRQFMYGIFS